MLLVPHYLGLISHGQQNNTNKTWIWWVLCQYLLKKLVVRECGGWEDIVRWLFDSVWRKMTGGVKVLHEMPRGWPWDYREQSFHSPWYLCFHGQTPMTNANSSSDIFPYPPAPNRHPTVLFNDLVQEKKKWFSRMHRSYTHIVLKILKKRGCKNPGMRMEVSLGKTLKNNKCWLSCSKFL